MHSLVHPLFFSKSRYVKYIFNKSWSRYLGSLNENFHMRDVLRVQCGIFNPTIHRSRPLLELKALTAVWDSLRRKSLFLSIPFLILSRCPYEHLAPEMVPVPMWLLQHCYHPMSDERNSPLTFINILQKLFFTPSLVSMGCSTTLPSIQISYAECFILLLSFSMLWMNFMFFSPSLSVVTHGICLHRAYLYFVMLYNSSFSFLSFFPFRSSWWCIVCEHINQGFNHDRHFKQPSYAFIMPHKILEWKSRYVWSWTFYCSRMIG